MKGILKRAAAIAVMLVLAVSLLASCSGSRTLLTVDGIAVTEEVMNYYVYISTSMLELYNQGALDYSAEIEEFGGRKLGDVVKELAYQQILNDYAGLSLAKQYGLEFDDEESELIERQVEKVIAGIGTTSTYRDFLRTVNISDKTYRQMLRNQMLLDKVEEYLVADAGPMALTQEEIEKAAADEINAAFGRASDYFSRPFDGEEAHRGDLYEMLYPAAGDPETDPVSSQGLRYTRKGSDTRPDSITIQTTGEGSGVLLAFRDSFGNSLYPYLADSFAEARFSRLTAYDLLLAEEMGADCVLVELVERNLVYLIQNVPVMPAPERPLPGQAQPSGEAALTCRRDGRMPQGCMLVQGKPPEGAEGRVYLSAGDRCWEAFQLEEGGFAAYIPADAVPETIWIQQEAALTALAVTAAAEE